jgi:hypothetical protein
MPKILDVGAWFRNMRPTPKPAEPEIDPLASFGSEAGSGQLPGRAPVASPQLRPRSGIDPSQIRLLAALAIVSAVGIGAYQLQKGRPFQVEAASASLTIESDPAGAEVLVGGKTQGTTPLTLSVTPGEHLLELVYDSRRKALKTVARAGAVVVHHVQFDTSPPVVVAAPAPAPVPRAVAPPRAPAAPVRPPKAVAAGPSAGWLKVTSPVALQIVEGSDIIGTSESSKILLPAGRHQLELKSDALGFSTRRVVDVVAGNKVATITVELPNAPLSLNALPWAEAWVDGKRLGETPIGNHLVRIGPHEVVFRHPELGERRQTVTVSLKTPARVSVDMRKPGS